MEYDVFISYSRKDSEVANRIYEALAAEGISCFIDREGISGGADFPTVLSEAIMGAKLLLFVASENSYTSEFTQKELTFAVNNKGSRFIFPFIVDGSSLPKNLEFLLSNINWRTLSSRYTIEKEMVAEVKKKLANPHAGETLEQRQNYTVKVLIFILLALIGLAVSIFLGVGIKNRRAQKVIENASENCQSWLNQANSCLHQIESIRSSRSNYKETFNRELDCLDLADSLLNQVDSVLEQYRASEQWYKFSAFSTSTSRKAIRAQRDSMAGEWWKYADYNYQDYQDFPAEDNREIALEYVTNAIRLRPGDSKLLEMKKTLTQ